MNIDRLTEMAYSAGYAEAQISGYRVAAALRVGKSSGRRLSWSCDGKRIALSVLRVKLDQPSVKQSTLFDLPGLPSDSSVPGGSPNITFVRVPVHFVPLLNQAYAKYMSESGETIALADFLGLVLVAGLEGFESV